ncbi:MAG TPA: Xaa-Pro peptidase family protein [Micromonosporaceae bacterium]
MSTGNDPAGLMRRLRGAAEAVADAGLVGMVVSPGPDLRYLTGYDALPMERLTCLVLPADGTPTVVVPELEKPAAQASPLGGLPVEIVTWPEIDDPYAMVASMLPASGRFAVDDQMWAAKLLAIGRAAPGLTAVAAGELMKGLRQHKTADELQALREAAEAIDAVHAQVPTWLRPGRTEREIARDIGDAILTCGHARVDFVIVASGPNGASPHHEVSDRVLQPGDPVVVDIGGTMPSGYRSDSTRCYSLGPAESGFLALYQVLREAQQAGCAAVRPGVSAESIDAASRSVIEAAGYGDYFVHRTGHGIGLETHEHPYIVAGNAEPVSAGMTFSIEPGIYLPDRFGMRLEDIVACTDSGVERLNQASRELVVVDL